MLPNAMIGHSIGEFVAAVLAGVFSLEDALRVVAARGRLMQELEGGAMLAVRLPEAQVRALLPPALAIAAINGPELCVVSGAYDGIDAFERLLETRGAVSRRLHTSHAFHSPMVDPVVEPLLRLLGEVPLAPPTMPYVSCVSGDWITPEQATSPHYWASHAREPVRFADGILTVSSLPSSILIEIGPGNTLYTLSLQATRGRAVSVLSAMQDSNRERHDRACLLEALGRAWIQGASPAWPAIHDGPRSRVPLPTYPFERSRYWIDAPPAASTAAADGPAAMAAATAATVAAAATAAMDDPPPSVIQDDSAMNPSPANDPIAKVGTALADIFEDLSGERHSPTDAHTTFLEMGYDSLFLTQVAQKIQSRMKVKITFRQLLGECSTLPALAGFLADKMPAAAVTAATAAAIAPAAPAAVPVSRASSVAAPVLSAAPVAAPVSPVAPLAAPVPPAPAAAAASTSPRGATAAAPLTADRSGIEVLFRDQLQAMSQLINRQFEILQGLGGSPAAPVSTADAAVRSIAAGPIAVTSPAAATAGSTASASVAGDRGAAAATGDTPAADLAAGPAQPSRFAVFVPERSHADNRISAEQRRHIDALIERYTKKTRGSKAFTQEHRAVLADPRAAAGFRTEWKEMVYPIVNTTSAGSKIHDVDGNEYIDLVNGFGQTAFGHAPPFVVEALRAQLDRGFEIGPQADMAGKVAALF